MNQASFEVQLKTLATRVNRALEYYLPPETCPPKKLHQAMRYAVTGGGKRIRPTLVYASGTVFDIPHEQLDLPACAVELIHSYSLVHDDLPAMDNDGLRRGRLTCHIAFDEATAVLTGDALQTLAFEILSRGKDQVLQASTQIEMIKTLAQASGSNGMAGGQAIDLAAVNQTLDLDALETMHRYKTGALIEASVRLGYLAAGEISKATSANLDHYAQAIGLAFQIQDDILDVISDTATLGKHQGADIALNKPTFPSLLGLEGAKQKAFELRASALDSLTEFGSKADLLRDIADYIIKRAF